MQMRACHPAGSTDNTDHLTLLNGVADIDKNLRLMPKAAIDTPAMIDNCRIPSHR